MLDSCQNGNYYIINQLPKRQPREVIIIKIDLDKLKKLRKQNKLTQEEVARVLGYKSALGYHYLENGRCQIKAEQIVILADIFKVPIVELFFKDQVAKMATKDASPKLTPTGTDGQ